MKLLLLFLIAVFSCTGSFAQNGLLKDSMTATFAYNEAEILNAENLLSTLKQLDASAISAIKLVGYTDSTGSVKRNKSLAAERIRSVEKLLKDSPVGTFTVKTENANEISGYRVSPDDGNRRVDILVYEKANVPDAASALVFEMDKPVNLNLNFKGGTAEFLPASYPNLETLKKAMLEDTTLHLNLHGHVCCDNDMPLSVMRAHAVMSYLNRNGVEASRMKAQGFSNSRPLFPDDSETHMSMNRRVEAIFYRIN